MFKSFLPGLLLLLIGCEVTKNGLVIPEEMYLEEGCYTWSGSHSQINSGAFSEFYLESIENGKEWVIHETLQSAGFDECYGTSKHYDLYSWNRDSVLTLKNYKKRELCSTDQAWVYMSGQTRVRLRAEDSRSLEFCYYSSSSSCEFRSDWIDLEYQRVCF